MAVLLLLVLIAEFVSSSAAPITTQLRSRKTINAPGSPFQTHYYTQTLDHFNFNPQSYATFQQRYLINYKYWGGAKTNSPIFVYAGPEGPISDYVGILDHLAFRFKGLILAIEHRYYGESIPFESEEIAFHNTSTLGYLSSTQALADYAVVITDLKKNLSAQGCPVIISGCSYGGMLAAWFRLKYPHIAYGALASSSPILYFEDIIPQDAYDLVVSHDYLNTSERCYNLIRESWFEMDRLAAQPGGLNELSRIFTTCSPLNSTGGLKRYLEDNYDYQAQYDSHATNLVTKLCNIIEGGTANLLDRVAAGLNATDGRQGCFPITDEFEFSKRRAWDWQMCTEMISPMGRGPNTTIFQAATFDLEGYTKKCRDAFGFVTPRPGWMTTEFGGHDIKSVLRRFGSNIIFTNGLRDPWSSGGVLENISDTILAIYTEKGAHCLEFEYAAATDPKWLVEQRRQVVNKISAWLQSYKTQA